MRQGSRATPITRGQRLQIQQQNAGRVANRRSISTFAANAARTSSSSLQRGGGQRQIGGSFESLQVLPENLGVQQSSISDSDIREFLANFQFDPRTEILSQSRQTTIGSRSLFSPQTQASLRQSSGRNRILGSRATRGSSRPDSVFGGTIFSAF